MKMFLIGVAVGATGMGLYTGHLKITIAQNQKSEPTATAKPMGFDES